MWILLWCDSCSLITYRVLLSFWWEREINEFGFWSSPVYLQRKCTQSTTLCEVLFSQSHCAWTAGISLVLSSKSVIATSTLPKKNHVGVGFLPGLHTEFFLLFVCFYPGTSILSYIIIWKDEMRKTYNEIKVQHLYFQTVNRLRYNN